MKNTGKSYETLAQRVFDEILNQQAVTTVLVQHDVILQGKSTSHQIDVYWEFKAGGITYKTIVQAKDWASSVDQGELLKFKAIIDDLPGQPRGIFVSKTGYQSGAIDTAKANGIVLYELREPTDKDWQGRVKTINLSLHFFLPKNGIEMIPDGKWVLEEAKRLNFQLDDKTNFEFAGMSNEMHLYDKDNNSCATMADVLKIYEPKEMKEVAPFITEHRFQEPTFLKTEMSGFPWFKINGLKITSSMTKHTEKIIIDGSTMVGYILRNVLDGGDQLFDKNARLKKPTSQA